MFRLFTILIQNPLIQKDENFASKLVIVLYVTHIKWNTSLLNQIGQFSFTIRLLRMLNGLGMQGQRPRTGVFFYTGLKILYRLGQKLV